MRAAESTHYYARDGQPMYEVPAASGKGMRPTTLRDARKLGLYPSVTTISRCAAAPALDLWKQKQVALAALTLPRVEGETAERLLERIFADSQQQSRNAADLGTEIHAACQGHFEGKPPKEKFWPHVCGVRDMIAANCGAHEWIAERSFVHPLGFGGKCDLHSQAWVIDFKTKEFTKEQAAELKTWDEHAMQLAAYREGLRVPTAECAIVYVSTLEPGLCRLIRIDESELVRGFDMFRALLNFWQSKNGYWPALWTPTQKEAA